MIIVIVSVLSDSFPFTSLLNLAWHSNACAPVFGLDRQTKLEIILESSTSVLSPVALMNFYKCNQQLTYDKCRLMF